MVHHKAPHRNWMPEQKYLDLYEDVEFPYRKRFGMIMKPAGWQPVSRN